LDAAESPEDACGAREVDEAENLKGASGEGVTFLKSWQSAHMNSDFPC